MAEINRNISFDTGIEQISEYAESAPTHLPETSQFVPGGGIYKQQLLDVLFPETIEQSMVESFRPEIMNRILLSPTGFHAAHKQCCEDIQEAYKTYAGRPEGTALEELAELLDDGAELNALLSTLRHLLQQA